MDGYSVLGWGIVVVIIWALRQDSRRIDAQRRFSRSQVTVENEVTIEDIVIQLQPAVKAVVQDKLEYDYSGYVAQNMVYETADPEWFIDQWVAQLVISPAEQLIINELQKYNVHWEREVSFVDMPVTSKGANYRFDFCLPGHSVVIEYHGKNWHTDVEKVNGDRLKEKFCRENKIEYIVYSGKDYYHMPHEIGELMERLNIAHL